jgi:hypothetical protein
MRVGCVSTLYAPTAVISDTADISRRHPQRKQLCVQRSAETTWNFPGSYLGPGDWLS